MCVFKKTKFPVTVCNSLEGEGRKGISARVYLYNVVGADGARGSAGRKRRFQVGKKLKQSTGNKMDRTEQAMETIIIIMTTPPPPPPAASTISILRVYTK